MSLINVFYGTENVKCISPLLVHVKSIVVEFVLTRDAPNIRPPKIFVRKGPKSAFSVFGPKYFYHQNNTAVMLWWRKQKPRPARACLKQHVCGVDVFLRKTHGQRNFKRGCICKDFLHVGFNLSPEIQTFRSLRWIWEERARHRKGKRLRARRFWKGEEVSQWHMGYGSLCFDTLLCWRPTEKILLYL